MTTASTPTGGRPRVGDGDQGPSRQSAIRLGDGQPAQIADLATRLVTQGSAIIRRAIAEVLNGTIRPPAPGDTVPPAGHSRDRRTVVIRDADKAALLTRARELDDAHPELLVPAPDPAMNPGDRDTQLVHALIRWGVAQVIATEAQRANEEV